MTNTDHLTRMLQNTVDQIRELIAAHGWAVLSQEREGVNPPFSYTVGLAAKDLPELILVGLEPAIARSALNRTASRLAAGEKLRNGQPLLEIIAGMSVIPRSVPPDVAERMMRFTHLLAMNKPWSAIQIVWPDPAGRFPGDPQYDTGWLSLQPMLELHTAPPMGKKKH